MKNWISRVRDWNHQTWYLSVRHHGEELRGKLLEAFERHPVYSREERSELTFCGVSATILLSRTGISPNMFPGTASGRRKSPID